MPENPDNPCFNPDCSACKSRRVHNPDEWKNHPLAGHGYEKGRGWSHPDAERLHNEELRTANANPNKAATPAGGKA